MQKYKVVASKSQKKYTVVVSADSPAGAKEKLHKDGYSVLTISEFLGTSVEGKKFLFQIEKDGEIKNGVIVWDDIFKVYVKLRDDLQYNVISLYPQWDSEYDDNGKKQKLLSELQSWYDIQKKNVVKKQAQELWEESFYLKKRLDETGLLVNSAIKKFEVIFNKKWELGIDESRFEKLEKIYEKLIHIKNSTNLVKLQEIWELALSKIAEIELQSVEEKKDGESRKLLRETNSLLKKIGSDKHFIERDKDWKRKIKTFFSLMLWTFSSKQEGKENTIENKKDLIDTESYNFLKTILLLQKYKEKKKENTKEIYKNFILFINPLNSSAEKERILLKRKVIYQNISLLSAKKNGNIKSYTGVKKWISKIHEYMQENFHYIASNILFIIVLYSLGLFSIYTLLSLGYINITISLWFVIILFSLIFFYFLCNISKNITLLSLNIVFWGFLYIFMSINF